MRCCYHLRQFQRSRRAVGPGLCSSAESSCTGFQEGVGSVLCLHTAWWQLPPLGPGLQQAPVLHLWHLPWLWGWTAGTSSPLWDCKLQSRLVPPPALVLALAVASQCTPGSQATAAAHPTYRLAKVRSFYLWAHGVRGPLQQRSLASLAGPGFFLDTFSYVIFAPLEYFNGSPSQFSPWGQTSQNLSLGMQPLLAEAGVKTVSSGKCWFVTIFVVNSLHFVFRALVSAFPSEVPKLPQPNPCPWGSFWVCGNFSSLWLPLRDTGPQHEHSVSYFSYIFCPSSFCGD